MKNIPSVRQRRSIRLQAYDYSQAGAYFVTVCSHHHQCIFGEIRTDVCATPQMQLNSSGKILQSLWDDLAKHYLNLELDAFVIMPNHIHGIIVMHEMSQKGAASSAPTLGQIMRRYKSSSTVMINRYLQRQGIPVWQRNYWEHIIRHEAELNALREYIQNNPEQWALDKLYAAI
ncbi:transposase [Iodobacter sp. CM08]|uniref:transposase n=1 Tax=Iodobacter sp. CM08 TaxID=3085902 RepID=UPI00298234B9|nr:transposase [Iodobacter sp. CM08]MDW5415585.1 transposase [Iodobacter sp. CM08]